MPRKRKQGPREPNGRLSRNREHRDQRRRHEDEMTTAEAKSVVIEARVRHGIPRELADLADAGRPNAGTVHGRMRLAGMNGDREQGINADQFDAAKWYIGRYLAYLRAIDAPGRERVPEDDEATGQGEGVTIAEATAEWRKVLRVLQDVSTETRSPVIAAMDTILVRQVFVHTMAGDLRLGLNAIHRTFLAGQRRAA